MGYWNYNLELIAHPHGARGYEISLSLSLRLYNSVQRRNSTFDLRILVVSSYPEYIRHVCMYVRTYDGLTIGVIYIGKTSPHNYLHPRIPAPFSPSHSHLHAHRDNCAIPFLARVCNKSILSLSHTLVTTRRSHRSIRNDIEDNMYRVIVYMYMLK